jgi:hypothetical protein
LVEKMRGHGVDTGTRTSVPQLEEQLGQAGFAAPKKPN